MDLCFKLINFKDTKKGEKKKLQHEMKMCVLQQDFRNAVSGFLAQDQWEVLEGKIGTNNGRLTRNVGYQKNK